MSQALSGAGAFSLAAPTTLSGIAIIAAQEGQAAYSGGGRTFAAQNQVVALRTGLNAIVDVSPDADINAANPNAPTITIIGANNSDTINLASGDDIISVGGAAETVNLGGGNNTISVNASTIGATIGNGTGQNTLDVSGGGTVAMGATNITDVATVLLAAASTPYVFTANGLTGLLINDESGTADTLQAGGLDQTLTGGSAGKDTFVGFSAGGDTVMDKSATFNGDTVRNLAAGDTFDFSDMDPAAVHATFTLGANGTSGVLNVSDGTHAAAVTLLGQFTGSFSTGPDSGAGTDISFYADSVQPIITLHQ